MAARLERDLEDLVALAAARRVDLDRVALLLADQGAGRGRGDRDLALLHVGLHLADDLVGLLLLGILILERDRAAEHHRVALQLGDVDDLGARQLVLELGDAALVQALRLLGRMVFGVLGQVAMRARLGDRLDDAWALDLLALFQLLFELGVTPGGHRDLVQLCHGVAFDRPVNLLFFQRKNAPAPSWREGIRRNNPGGRALRGRRPLWGGCLRGRDGPGYGGVSLGEMQGGSATGRRPVTSPLVNAPIVSHSALCAVDRARGRRGNL